MNIESQKVQKRKISHSKAVENRPKHFVSDERMEELKILCHELDPFQQMSLEQKLRLQEFGVKDLSNPFEITNKLLLILEENLQYRKKINDHQS